MTDPELERALEDLGAHLEHPATPPIAEAVAARLAQAPAPGAGRAPRPLPRRRWQRLALAGLVVVLLAAVVLAASPATREAAARLLGLRGVKIVLGGPTATTREPLGTGLYLGQPATLAQARARVGFTAVVPTAPGFERPDAVYVDPGQPSGGRVDFVYRARPGLPTSSSTGVGLVVTQFQAGIDESFIKKSQLGEGGAVQAVTVDGQPGYWFSGPHDIAYLDRDGNEQYESSRLAGRTLLWERGDLTLRLEGEVTRQEALRIAASMR